MIKDADELPDKELQNFTFGSVLSIGPSVLLKLGCVNLIHVCFQPGSASK